MSASVLQYPLLHLIAARSDHKGLIANNPWLLEAYTRAIGLFSDRTLHGPAVVLACVHEAAIDYLVQAPVLVCAIAGKTDLSLRDHRQRVSAQFKVACNARPRLRDLMRHYGVAPQLRALHAELLCRGHHRLLKALSEVAPSRLAQCIPAAVEEQRDWLSAIEEWRTMVSRVTADGDWLVGWAAANRCHTHRGFDAADMIDFAARNRAAFDLDWNFTQAVAASMRWHETIARRSLQAAFREEDLGAVVDYGALPDEATVDGLRFVALRTRLQLFDEGRAMHHCVSTYADLVFAGHCWIYSVRQDENRVATLEIRHSARGFAVAQLRSHCNRLPVPEAVKAATRFVAQVNTAFELVPAGTPRIDWKQRRIA